MAETSTYWRITLHKFWLAAGGESWANSYEYTTYDKIAVTAEIHATIAEAVGQYEQALHGPNVYIDRAVVSTDPVDGSIYDPTTFRIIPMGFQGDRNVTGAGDPVDLNAVYNVRKIPSQGRPGKNAYRGVLYEADVSGAAQGLWDLQSGSGLLPLGGTWLGAYAFISPFIGGGHEADLVMIQQPTASNPSPIEPVRIVTGIQPVGAGFNRMNHRYFDRGPS